MSRKMQPIQKTTACLCAAVVFLCALPYSAQAAWTRKSSQWFVANTLSFYNTNHFIHDNGQRIYQPRFAKQEWNSYVEYGWREDVTLGGNIFLQRLAADYNRYSPTRNNIESGTEENYGLADSEFFLRKRLWQGTLAGNNAVLSLQPLIKLPSAYYSAGNPRGGTDNFDAELRLQGGYNFPMLGLDHYAMLDLGYRKRFGEWRDQFKADSTLGIALNDKFTLLLQGFLTHRTEGNTQVTLSNAAVNDYDLIKAQASVVYRFNDRTRIQLGSFKHIYARNTGDGQGFLLSLWREF